MPLPRRAALPVLLLVSAACGARRPPAAPLAAGGAACLAEDPAVARVLSDLRPAQRDLALRALEVRAARDAPEAARLAASGKNAAEIVEALEGGREGAARAGGGEADDSDRAPPPPPAEYRPVTVPEWAPIRGPRLAKVTLVVFSDFQCPFCARLVPTVEALEKKYGDRLRVVWRNEPLPFHPRARPAAEVAMAAAAQGRFWEVHDRIFASPRDLDDDTLRRYAREAGVDASRLDADLAAHRQQAQIDSDLADGRAAGVSGTPTVFVNGRKIAGAYPAATFAAVIDEELVRADKLLAGGVALADLYPRLLAANPAPPPAAAEPEDDGADARPVEIRIPADAPARGRADAPVTIVQFSDFQCPFCGRALPTLEALERKYPGRLRVVFLHLPLPFHASARLAAEAAMAAHAQGRFWLMHDKLFANQKALERSDLERYAGEINLDLAAFRKALDEHTYGDRIQRDLDEAARVGAEGTPTFYVNGVPIEGAQPQERFEAVIDRLLAAAPAAPARRAKPTKAARGAGKKPAR